MVAAVRRITGVVCPVSCKLQNLSIKLFSGSVSEPLAPDPCVFPPQHSAVFSCVPPGTTHPAHPPAALFTVRFFSSFLRHEN